MALPDINSPEWFNEFMEQGGLEYKPVFHHGRLVAVSVSAPPEPAVCCQCGERGMDHYYSLSFGVLCVGCYGDAIATDEDRHGK